MVDESLAARWARRIVSTIVLVAATSLWLVGSPVLLAGSLVLDVARQSRFAACRFVLMIAVYLGCESAGLLAGTGLWVVGPRRGPVWVRRNFALQRWWAGTLFAAGERLFELDVEVEGSEVLGRVGEPGAAPFLLLVRHASVADTLLPAVFVSGPTGRLLRYVLKRELLWDPCLDLVGQRLPNVFVRRGSNDPARELATVRRLAEGLGADEGVILFPEGTRFSPRRRADALARLGRVDPALHTRAAGLTHVLPPRTGGTLALLDAAPALDVVVCAHVGFDGTLRLGDLWSGGLLRRRVRVAFWRCARAEIPPDREGRVDWLYRQWERVDAWVSRAATRSP